MDKKDVIWRALRLAFSAGEQHVRAHASANKDVEADGIAETQRTLALACATLGGLDGLSEIALEVQREIYSFCLARHSSWTKCKLALEHDLPHRGIAEAQNVDCAPGSELVWTDNMGEIRTTDGAVVPWVWCDNCKSFFDHDGVCRCSDDEEEF